MGTTSALSTAGRWAPLLAPPTAWSLTLLANYVLTARACGPSLRPFLLVIAAAMLAVVAISARAAWHVEHRTGTHGSDEDAAAAGRDRFMARMALLACGLFAAAIVAQGLTPWFLHDCS